MYRLSEHLRFYVLKKQTEDPLWQGLACVARHVIGCHYMSPG
jgi:hypothetical protein